MKDKIIGWGIFTAILLVIGFALFNSITVPHGTAAAEAPTYEVPAQGSSPVSSEFGSLEQDRLNRSAKTTVANSVSLDSAKGYEVLDERQTIKANGDVERRRLVKRAGAHPYRIVVDTLRRDRTAGKFIPAGSMEMVADHLMVNLREGVPFHILEALAAKHNATVSRALSDEHTFIVQLEAPGIDAVETAVTFFEKAASEIAYAEPDYVRHLSKLPNDTMYGELWGLPKISAPDAWDISTGSRSVVVAVIDSGMDMNHPDLISNLWNNPNEIAGDGLDNDGNGYVDDVNGWDFVAGDNDPEDGNGHGTHTAGTIGAVGNNNNQVVGVCWNVSIMPVRAGSGAGALLDSDIVDSIRYAARNGAKVLSNSYGGTGFSQTMYDAVSYANDQGAIFIAAAGNESTDNDALPQYPASYDLPNVVAVAATDSNDSLASFSNYGETSVDLAAPGVNIVSTYLNAETASLDGTSMACPQVAGAVALLYSVQPNLAPEEAKSLLLASVDPVASLTGKVVTGGRLNVHALFANANDGDKDGIPDSWEELYGLNPQDATDGDLDPDNDFLSNLQEFRNGCNPTNSDTDADSLIDGWEVLYEFNPLNVPGTLPRMQYLGFNAACNDAWDLTVTGNYAYVADGVEGLKILSLTDPANPVLIGSYATAGDVRGLDVASNYAYLADLEKGLFIIDISNPADPVMVASLETSASKVDVEGGVAYVAALTNGLKVASVASPSAPAWIGEYKPQLINAYDAKLLNGQLVLGMNGHTIKLNISNPAHPFKVKSFPSYNDNVSVEVDNGYIVTAAKPFGPMIYSEILQPLGSYETPGTAEAVFYSEGLVYVADGAKGLLVLNAADPANMTYYAKNDTIHAYGVTVADGYVYVAGRDAGIHIFRSSVDSDGDGMYDGWENNYFGDLSQGPGDDPDNDGISNWGEYLVNLIPTDADQDNDGLIDGFAEVRQQLTDPRKQDTDGDGLADGFEVTTNGTDNLYLTDPLEADTDGDGMTDKWEIDNSIDPLTDDAVGDPDADGASNLEEKQSGTDPQISDTDADGMPDGWEISFGLNPLADDAGDDPDGDNTTAGLDLSNLGEYLWRSNGFAGLLQQSTDPNLADTDGDLLDDNWEISVDASWIATNVNGVLVTNLYRTDPNQADTDGDGMPDGWEISFGLNPTSTNGNNGATGDMDGDGLSNYEEFLNGSDPYSNDTDGDQFTDDWERDWGTQATNRYDPVVVDDDAPQDRPVQMGGAGGMPQDPDLSDPDEDGSAAHPFDAVQEAINVASNGFTILVKPGQYYGSGNRDINLGAKQLRIMAEDQANPASTVLKSHGLSPVIVFDGGQHVTNTVLAGFTVRSSMQGVDCSNGDCGKMNGIICRDASSPLITNCVVEICRADAILCDFNSSPVLSNVTVRTIYEGHGIYAKNGSTPTVLGCTIKDIYSGAGIYATDSIGLEVADSLIENCNNSTGSGRGIYLVNDATATIVNTTVTNCQGGIHCDNSSPMIDRCTISGNSAPDYYTFSSFGGFFAASNIAVWCEDPDNEATDERHLEENGGGILLRNGSFPVIQNSVIHNNLTTASDPEFSSGNVSKPYYGLGGGIYAGADCSVRLINCTVAHNSAMTLGGGFTTFGNYVEFLRNDVLWSNRCNAAWLDTDVDPPVLRKPGNALFNTLHCNEGTSHFDPWYCNLSDGFGFVGDRYNISADPLFAGSSDFHILTNSPCVDAGTFAQAPLYDRDGTARPLNGSGVSNAYYSIDIGAYEYINPNADTDGDGILDVNEIGAGTNPTMIDSDQDGMSDGFENAFGLNAAQNDAAADADGDGLSNAEEYAAGTAPNNMDTDGDNSPDGDEMIAGTIATDPNSFFYVHNIRPLAGGGCVVVFDTVQGRKYMVYCSSQLGGQWTPVGLEIDGTGSPVEVQDLFNESTCFYKVEVRK